VFVLSFVLQAWQPSIFMTEVEEGCFRCDKDFVKKLAFHFSPSKSFSSTRRQFCYQGLGQQGK
jgi:hypothetical protein